ncbi:membrane protein [Methanolobus vulcani]|jgi:membrane protein|uniref:Membrane protein n=1 Tax=Methanolobus vulcani TaxID=38026 RepID=A0A7Z7FEA8_9EURY|nr:YihY/virulence factor BrkB family protein [Methanolobus vulcani]MDK2826760.1 rane protein [Methanolobus sp.]MDK2947653.1 rane protein [Methanolobus sp.]SDF80335.1 membrane protein [Methanolobus vulcani]
MISIFEDILKTTLDRWAKEDGITNSASLSFHALIGIPSLLLFTLFIGSIFLKQQLLQAAILTDVSVFAGDVAIEALNTLFTQLSVSSPSNFGIVFSFLIYLWSAGNIFFQIKKLINKMWGLTPSNQHWLHQFFHTRLSALIAAIAFGTIVSVSTLFEMLFFVISDAVQEAFSISVYSVQYASFGINFITLIILFMYLFRVLPDATMNIKYVFMSSFLTVLLLTLGKYVIGFYLSYSSITTVYGTIGSILAILLWIYMSSIIVTFMIVFTRVYADYDSHTLDRAL